MTNKDEAKKAVQEYDGSIIDGKPISVRMRFEKPIKVEKKETEPKIKVERKVEKKEDSSDEKPKREGRRGGRGGRGRGRGGRGGSKREPKPKVSAEDLNKDLDDYMKKQE